MSTDGLRMDQYFSSGAPAAASPPPPITSPPEPTSASLFPIRRLPLIQLARYSFQSWFNFVSSVSSFQSFVSSVVLGILQSWFCIPDTGNGQPWGYFVNVAYFEQFGVTMIEVRTIEIRNSEWLFLSHSQTKCLNVSELQVVICIDCFWSIFPSFYLQA
jgi:hypothetical protein